MLSHPSDRDCERGICAPVMRIGLPTFVNRNERMDEVYAWILSTVLGV